jgi:uncharacterized protein (DUF486 family)
MAPFIIVALVLFCPPAFYFAWRSREFRKFLAGAFFVSSGIQFYLYLARVSMPLLGTSAVQTPELSLARSLLHFVLFLLCLYFGFIKSPKNSGK